MESLPDTEDEDTEAEEDALGLSLAAFLQPSTVLESVPSIASYSYLRIVSTLTPGPPLLEASRADEGCTVAVPAKQAGKGAVALKLGET